MVFENTGDRAVFGDGFMSGDYDADGSNAQIVEIWSGFESWTPSPVLSPRPERAINDAVGVVPSYIERVQMPFGQVSTLLNTGLMSFGELVWRVVNLVYPYFRNLEACSQEFTTNHPKKQDNGVQETCDEILTQIAVTGNSFVGYRKVDFGYERRNRLFAITDDDLPKSQCTGARSTSNNILGVDKLAFRRYINRFFKIRQSGLVSVLLALDDVTMESTTLDFDDDAVEEVN